MSASASASPLVGWVLCGVSVFCLPLCIIIGVIFWDSAADLAVAALAAAVSTGLSLVPAFLCPRSRPNFFVWVLEVGYPVSLVLSIWILEALFALLKPESTAEFSWRVCTAAILLLAWAVRLFAFLTWRGSRFSRYGEHALQMVVLLPHKKRLLALWAFLFLTVLVNGAPLWFLGASTRGGGTADDFPGGFDIAGILLCVSGLLGATVFDFQRFHAAPYLHEEHEYLFGHPSDHALADSATARTGLKPSPRLGPIPLPYLCEIAFFWGIFFLAVSPLIGLSDEAEKGWRWLSILGPLHVTAALIYFACFPPRYSWGFGAGMVASGKWCASLPWRACHG